LYLSKLEILGFKSFAQKTEVTFNPGVTSIVGPNGCGKTNIVDAIRWCLGEQRSGALRSDKMENVIFNGTSNRKPMGMAEVSLTIENSKGILPTEYSEVTITRRIFRSGESEYLLNKSICRLKDITNLFMDTGIGANAYSVIELKMIETILSSKADERRTMFEEAAGVNKYKMRRRLALRKLDEVKADLTRVNDIVSEVEKKVNSLERQAKKADKYNKISTTLRELELELAEREMALFTLQKLTNKDLKDEKLKEKIEFESEITKLEDELRGLKLQSADAEAKLKSKRSEISLQTEKIHSIKQSISVSEERKKALERNIERFKQELEELKIQLEENEDLIVENKDKIASTAGLIVAKEEEKKQRAEDVVKHREELTEKRAVVKAQSEQDMERFKEINNRENDLRNVERSLKNTNAAIERINERIQALTTNIAKTVGYLEDLTQEKNETEERIAEAEELYARKQKEKESLEKQLNELKGKELEERSIINGLKDKISFIKGLIDNLEGVSKGAKALLENDTWLSGEKTLLAHIGNSSEEYRFAVEAALKNNLNNILVETIDDLKNGIEYLKNNDIGKASFYVAGLKGSSQKTFSQKIVRFLSRQNEKKLQKEAGFLGWAESFVETEEKWRPFFSKILDKVAVVDSLERSIELFPKYPDFNFTTTNGDFINSSGIVEGGSAPKLDDSLFGRKQILENLMNEFPRREQHLETIKEEITKVEETLNQIDLKVLSERGKLLVNDLANVEKQIAQFEFEKKKASDEIEKAHTELQDYAGQSNRYDNERIRLTEILETQHAEKQKADEERERLEAAVKAMEAEYNQVLGLQNRANLEYERLLGEKRNLENELERSENSIVNINKSISKREFDITSSAEESAALTSHIEDIRLDLDELEYEKSKLTKDEAELDAGYREIRSQIVELEKVQGQFRDKREEAANLIHSAEIKLNELNLKIENLKNNIHETYSLTIETKEFEDNDTFDFKQRTDEVHQLKQQIRQLGPINLLSYSEYEEEKERLDFLLKQRKDLIESEKDVIKTIEEINTSAQTLFSETFEKIRGHFIRIFRGLFNPGDEADLKLEENTDPLEGKIEIIAKPKGKRPTSIELLSGGEKTLTAIALLFSIYLVKPSPFCILDEIDAPLDDANVDRFTKIIKEFSKDTQFIIVTHNKRTMESAETLYGVTMQEEGISKLVSVRFNEDFNIE
jgi:chromosome segregation protein